MVRSFGELDASVWVARFHVGEMAAVGSRSVAALVIQTSKAGLAWGLQEQTCAAPGHASEPGPSVPVLKGAVLLSLSPPSVATLASQIHPLPASRFLLKPLLYKALLGREMCLLLRKRRYNGQLPVEEDGSPSQKSIERL